MNVIWIILAVFSFVGGQIYLFRHIMKLDKAPEKSLGNEPTFCDDDSCRYPDEDVIE